MLTRSFCRWKYLQRLCWAAPRDTNWDLVTNKNRTETNCFVRFSLWVYQSDTKSRSTLFSHIEFVGFMRMRARLNSVRSHSTEKWSPAADGWLAASRRDQKKNLPSSGETFQQICLIMSFPVHHIPLSVDQSKIYKPWRIGTGGGKNVKIFHFFGPFAWVNSLALLLCVDHLKSSPIETPRWIRGSFDEPGLNHTTEIENHQ